VQEQAVNPGPGDGRDWRTLPPQEQQHAGFEDRWDAGTQVQREARTQQDQGQTEAHGGEQSIDEVLLRLLTQTAGDG
jgi:hypothetical protein